MKLGYESEPEISMVPQVEEISQWVYEKNTKPLLITSSALGGKKTLIWEYIKQKDNNDIVIS